jgi:hypothetical protein
MAQQPPSLTPAEVATTPPSTAVAADTTPPSTWAAAATTDNKPPPPWVEEDIIDDDEQASHPFRFPPSRPTVPALLMRLSSLLCARRRGTTHANANAHRKAVYARSTHPPISTSISTSHSFDPAATLDKWRDVNYALDAHGYYS